MRTLALIAASMRPRQWTKNLFVAAALLFAGKLFDRGLALRTALAVLAFCVASGAVYLVNDLLDRKRDRSHPRKSLRPIASGTLGAAPAAVAAAVLLAVALAGGAALGRPFALALLVYLAIQAAYCTVLRNVVILDAFALAAGFVARVVAGAVAIDVEISSWLLVCTTLIALFLALCKRRQELSSLAGGAARHREVLAQYSEYLLDQMIAVAAAATVVAYALYTMAESTIAKFGSANLIFTLPFVIYGLFRYLFLVHRRDEGGSPEQTLMTDLPLLVDVLLWALAAGVIVYR
jgi:4-hydroxybenzoate polyprenyltransferase